MISSARRRSALGTAIPSAPAVFMLTAVTNLAGRSIGSSEGLAPFRMRSTKKAARR